MGWQPHRQPNNHFTNHHVGLLNGQQPNLRYYFTDCRYMISFEWDEAKRRKNLHKHGIDFVDVVSMFDGFIVTIEDTSYSYDDVRFLTLGQLKSHVVVVVHTETDEIIRIISARKATKNETLKYYKSTGN